MKTTYKIFMKTELGKREGTLVLCENADEVAGTLDILRHTNEIQGKKTSDESGYFSGKMQTYLYELPYIATYQIDGNFLHGKIDTQKGVFNIEGHRID